MNRVSNTNKLIENITKKFDELMTHYILMGGQGIVGYKVTLVKKKLIKVTLVNVKCWCNA